MQVSDKLKLPVIQPCRPLVVDGTDLVKLKKAHFLGSALGKVNHHPLVVLVHGTLDFDLSLLPTAFR